MKRRLLALLLAVLTLTMLTAAAFAADATEAGAYYIRTEAGYTLTVEDAASDGGFYKGASKFKLSCENLPGQYSLVFLINADTAQTTTVVPTETNLYYIDQNGDKVRPYIIHRTSMGCYERTLAWLIEKYAGKFPTWLCPEQVRVLPISDKYMDYAESVLADLKKNGIDATVDGRSEKIGYKIREARMDKLPYMLVVGGKEEEAGLVSVRSRFAGDEGQKPLADFINDICQEIRTKEIRKELPEDEKK